jgi:hypothetical protein
VPSDTRPAKRRRIHKEPAHESTESTAGGFIPDDDLGGGFLPDDGAGGGFLPEDGGGFLSPDVEAGGGFLPDDAGGFVPEPGQAESLDDAGPPPDSIPLNSIPALLDSLEIPADEDILAIFEDATDDDGQVSRQHFLKVAAILVLANENQGDDGGLSVDDDEAEVVDQEEEDWTRSAEESDEAVATSTTRQTRAQARRNPRDKGKAVALPSDEGEDDEALVRGTKGRPRKMTPQRKAQALATFELFGPQPVPGKGNDKIITLEQLRNVARLLNEKLSDQEVCPSLDVETGGPRLTGRWCRPSRCSNMPLRLEMDQSPSPTLNPSSSTSKRYRCGVTGDMGLSSAASSFCLYLS